MAAEEVVDETSRNLAEVISASFPDIKCLRCSNDKFYLSYDDQASNVLTKLNYTSVISEAKRHSKEAVAQLICRRCGHIEQHLASFLYDANKPIVNGANER